MAVDRRILIVDDEEKVAFFLRESLEELGQDFAIEAAGSAEEALEKIESQPFDLVISDLRMPGIDGLELLEKVKEESPNTRLILMTAYGSDEVEAEARRLEVYEYITKPFHVSDLIEVARDALADVAMSAKGMLALSDDQFEEINRHLASLRFEVGAQCILLADLAGQVVSEVGITEGLDTGTFMPLIADGFATAFKMAQYLRDEETFNLNLYEGKSYDIYSTSVDDNRKVIEAAAAKLAGSEEEAELTGEVESESFTFNVEEALKKGLIDEDFAQLLRGED